MQIVENKCFIKLSDPMGILLNLPKGWKCPFCKKVYSPKVKICYKCNLKYKVQFKKD
jgi:hypothetical protein